MIDKRFSTAGKLIRANELKAFSEIISIVPKTVIAKHLGINPERFNRLIDDISLLVVKDLVKLAHLMEVDFLSLMKLIDHDLPKPKHQK